jgi:hypothetical protein
MISYFSPKRVPGENLSFSVEELGESIGFVFSRKSREEPQFEQKRDPSRFSE